MTCVVTRREYDFSCETRVLELRTNEYGDEVCSTSLCRWTFGRVTSDERYTLFVSRRFSSVIVWYSCGEFRRGAPQKTNETVTSGREIIRNTKSDSLVSEPAEDG